VRERGIKRDVCVCVCEREREGGREGGKVSDRRVVGLGWGSTWICW